MVDACKGGKSNSSDVFSFILVLSYMLLPVLRDKGSSTFYSTCLVYLANHSVRCLSFSILSSARIQLDALPAFSGFFIYVRSVCQFWKRLYFWFIARFARRSQTIAGHATPSFAHDELKLFANVGPDKYFQFTVQLIQILPTED
jgi:hypothetical protein